MQTHSRGRTRRRAIVAGIVSAAILACAALASTRADAQSAGRAEGLTQALMDGASRHVPKGYSAAKAARVTLNDDDRRSGMVTGVLVTLGGGDPKGSLRYALFPSEQQAEAFLRELVYRRPIGSSAKFLQYLPSADCADTPSGGLCTMRAGEVVIVATAGAVDRGASLVMIAAKDAVDAATATLRSGPSSSAAAPGSAATRAKDVCALLTKTDAATALGGPVSDPRRGGDTCYYGAQLAGRDSVTLQMIEGGRSKFDFDRGRMQRIASAAGIGDDAFSFVSDAGFVQIYFIKGTSYASLTLQNSRDANKLEIAKALARKIAADL